MVVHLMRDLDRLKNSILELGSLVEESVDKAVAGLLERDIEAAREAANGDERIDRKEVLIEEDCLKILALHQPVAADLRYIIMVLKVNNDFERIGDLAVNLAERSIDLAGMPTTGIDLEFERMTRTVRSMIHDSLVAMVQEDEEMARAICEADRVVDEIHRLNFDRVEEALQRNPSLVAGGSQMLSASRYLERMADQATNIAEDVIFQVRGEIMRHDAELTG